MSRDFKIAAAKAALTLLEDGMKIGLGTGSTAEELVRALAPLVADGLSVIAVPTSERTGVLAKQLGIPVATLDEYPHLDLTIDGADEIDSALRLIKGGGAAHLREKIVACASDRMAVIADHSKLVGTLGAFPLPLEVIPFGLAATRRAIEHLCRDTFALAGPLTLRKNAGNPVLTDSGNVVLDASFGRIPDPEGLAAELSQIPGLVEHGLFINIADIAFVAGPDGVATITPGPAD
uniref:ribose-5-phosphate isomerase RpiA n=1 Tax=Pararhizobium sp. IMCC3301 TaxID=3067904 RepID=UPI0027415101|nr:ribose-5-phosphate isomerase RpiA [Pararhizobium sp. IMCC3301]